MNWYPWLTAPYRQLVEQHQQGRAHHALLIQAQPGMGDASLVWGLSRWLMCQQRDGLKSCGHCHSCQLMQAMTHPDWYRLEAEPGKSALGIDAVRQVTEKLYHRAQQGGEKIVWLPAAGQLTEAAANALLKTLEEPPDSTWFILCSHQPGRLLATLRSRCISWHLAPPEETFSQQWLHSQTQKSAEEIITALRLSSGAPVAALGLLDDKRWAARHALCQGLPGALSEDMLSLLPLLNHDDVAERLGWLCTLLLDALKWQQNGALSLANIDSQTLVSQIASRLPARVLDESLRQWMHCREQLLTVAAVNRELLLTDCLLRWEKLLAASPLQENG
ncbi:DNA polymerase III subunit delta' [Erwinia sp. OLTSP20]|uniref:DNA polymerase III subunit delta' n=1 Tax=unclassified Erwinia TaxID=2622719 RepID=UPI000C197897|nr:MULTISPECIES: DNA polymerase III subunit delta' [unclassified Erwinia]PIJ51944.1 DNA polymerase III subunit delta' [Erwinia sp. OAMSP11]PIJ74819.1 DNA polymerase III subunit delta' [Erwinia sp. OLSSP12]PIJ85205.1 DNA polymerase III subunit delta' [Erwinia sp. OLCASP19]PIJ87206.1 DNA polymerase III subunit delta' [Erwinia sp. OLMTSP26]PIJ88350.1 DNA polymerase III subunit delta' [Erwinia sp. OLMDSP33]